jgi:hypothetical protein
MLLRQSPGLVLAGLLESTNRERRFKFCWPTPNKRVSPALLSDRKETKEKLSQDNRRFIEVMAHS